MISASNIYIQYGDRILLDRVNMVVQIGEKIGLVGRNGAGKSTMLKILAGELSPHEGQVSRAGDTTLCFLHQEIDLPTGHSVMEETLTAFAGVRDMEKEIDRLNDQLATRTDYESDAYMKLIEDVGHLGDRFHLLGGHTMQADAEKVLKGLGFKAGEFDRAIETFSGGWQMRIQLAKMLLQKPDFLLLDEPTNHLDIESIIWLESYLKTFAGAVILISHDRRFLDNITKRTVEIELGKLYDYKANYSLYLDQRQMRRDQLAAAFNNQQKLIAQKERTIERFKAKASKASMAQSMQKQLDKIDRIELDDEEIAAMRLRFPPAPRSGQVVVECKDLTKKYGENTVLDKVEFRLERGERVAFVGQNGQGKSTLAKMIVKEIEKSAGDLNLGYNVSIGYYAQNQSEALPSSLTLLETMESESPAELRPQIRKILAAFLFSGEDVYKKVSVLSGGERARLAMACMLLHPFNLLVLDEPTNHLDMISKEVLKKALEEYDGAMIVVSHDRDFLTGMTDQVLEFRDRKLHHYLGDVNHFLEKRQTTDLREIERSSTAPKPKAAVAPDPVQSEERKKLQRQVAQAEKNIERLEADIATFETQMAVAGFYERPDAQKIMSQYDRVKAELQQAMEAWEESQMALEELG